MRLCVLTVLVPRLQVHCAADVADQLEVRPSQLACLCIKLTRSLCAVHAACSMFAIALNFIMSASLEVAFDVPALSVAFLFALPFAREVQPSIPIVDITVDIMGFLFNVRDCWHVLLAKHYKFALLRAKHDLGLLSPAFLRPASCRMLVLCTHPPCLCLCLGYAGEEVFLFA